MALAEEFVFVTLPTLGLAHVTYRNTYREREPGDWPHHRAIKRTWYVCTVCTYLARHGGRWVMWQVSHYLPSVRVDRREDD